MKKRLLLSFILFFISIFVFAQKDGGNKTPATFSSPGFEDRYGLTKRLESQKTSDAGLHLVPISKRPQAVILWDAQKEEKWFAISGTSDKSALKEMFVLRKNKTAFPDELVVDILKNLEGALEEIPALSNMLSYSHAFDPFIHEESPSLEQWYAALDWDSFKKYQDERVLAFKSIPEKERKHFFYITEAFPSAEIDGSNMGQVSTLFVGVYTADNKNLRKGKLLSEQDYQRAQPYTSFLMDRNVGEDLENLRYFYWKYTPGCVFEF